MMEGWYKTIYKRYIDVILVNLSTGHVYKYLQMIIYPIQNTPDYIQCFLGHYIRIADWHDKSCAFSNKKFLHVF